MFCHVFLCSGPLSIVMDAPHLSMIRLGFHPFLLRPSSLPEIMGHDDQMGPSMMRHVPTG